MRRKSSKQLFSVLMAATMVMSGISIPVNASQVDDAVVRSVLTKTAPIMGLFFIYYFRQNFILKKEERLWKKGGL